MNNEFATCKLDEKSYVPKYCQLKELLGNMIKNLKANEMVPSEHHLAEQFKVHRLTARQAITELVNDGLLYRVRGSGTFVAEKKSENISNTIACIFRNIRPKTENDNFFLEIFEAFEDELSKNKKFMLYKCLNNMSTDNEILETVSEMLAAKVGGLVLDERIPDSIISKLNNLKIPALIINRRSPIASISSVVPDNKYSIELALHQLYKLGHKKILFIYETASLNQLEMADELKQRQGNSDDIMIIPATEKDFSGKTYRDAAVKGLKLHQPTAIITGFDWIAKNAYEEIQKHGLKIPEDISLISIGGFDLATRLSPPLTTVRINTEEMGRMAAKAVLSPEKYQGDVVVPTILTERASCAKLK